ncbi:glycosyltransferase family protein [Pontibacter pamirensis]|uniref:glycosyltransferase family protein n=1 Tax=Pontibacter pamirensis TaxID=2562824 RepID=UPI001389E60C|nr:glycosyltransferase [Pontibacter pamirensis]
MEKVVNKPKLLFFQWQHDSSPKFLQLHMQLHVKCLAEFFEVILINKDCDYQQVCDFYHPEVALFEGGYKTSYSKKLTIKNTNSFPEIPKIGLHNGDPWCDCRPGFLSEMEQWSIETFFSISTTVAEHTPEIADNLFVWPNFIDSEIYRDYGEPKAVPVMFSGSMISLYPWRQKVFKQISNHYPTLTFPHLGYESHSPLMKYGEEYARSINASWFAPACGTVAKEIVRKHFEVPGCNSCLITEKSPSLEAAGFVDMQNCVFADENDVLDKLNYLFKNRHKLEEITTAGYNLVHSRHTYKQRNQISQWYNLYKDLKSNERIVQSSPFEALSIVKKTSGIRNNPIVCKGLHLEFLHKGDQMLLAGNYDEAEAIYFKSLDYISSMCEPKLKIAICELHKGNVEKALHWIIQPLRYNLGIYGAIDSDPVEWAYYIITLLCQGKLNEATIRARQFPSLNHPELDRIRWVIDYLRGREVEPFNQCAPTKFRHTIHQLPQLCFVDWLINLCNMLKACKQFRYVEILSICSITNETSIVKSKIKNKRFVKQLKNRMLLIRINGIEKLNSILRLLKVPAGRNGLPSITIWDYMFRIMKWLKLKIYKHYHLN